MTFRPATAAASTPASEAWKAQGFLNFYLPAKNGARKKLGAIPLKESRASERDLLNWLNEDPSRVQVILSKLELEYQSALPADTAGFALQD
jgi:hypothetical protein